MTRISFSSAASESYAFQTQKEKTGKVSIRSHSKIEAILKNILSALTFGISSKVVSLEVPKEWNDLTTKPEPKAKKASVKEGEVAPAEKETKTKKKEKKETKEKTVTVYLNQKSLQAVLKNLNIEAKASELAKSETLRAKILEAIAAPEPAQKAEKAK